MREAITIDGSFGEGGGQILRTCLALSLITRKPFHLVNIRAGRKRPGLMHQHLTSVRAATEIGGAEVHGDSLGSPELRFAPRDIIAGQYKFTVPTAGSCLLVLQAVLPALLMASHRSELILQGGTHNPLAPPYDFVVGSFVPLLRHMGAHLIISLERCGFYPAGGGRIHVLTETAGGLSGLSLLERGEPKRYSVRAVVANLPAHIAEREIAALQKRLDWEAGCFAIEVKKDVRGQGNVIFAELEFVNITEVISAFGKRGVPAEDVAAGLAQDIDDYLSSGAPVGKYLADQLLVPLAVAGEGRYRTVAVTEHTRTNIEVLKRFLNIRVNITRISTNLHEIELRLPKQRLP